MKKRNKKRLLAGLISVLALSSCGGLSACKSSVNYDSLKEEGLYEFTYDKPFYATPDAYMSIDGKLDEEIWQEKNWFESTSGTANTTTSIKATTAFTSSGVYVGAIAYDTNITWIARNNFKETGNEKTNSFFMIRIIKSGTKETNDRMQDSYFYMDCKNTCSYRERQYVANVDIVGEVNSGETTSLSGELFLPWSEMGYSEAELTEYGYPQDIQMDVKYLRVFSGTSGNNFTVKSSPLQAYTFTSYPYYDENGLVGTYDCEEFGNAIGGAPATDKWELEQDEHGKVTKLTSTVDRAQTIFFRQDSEGNTKSKASDFILETRVKVLPLGEKSVPVCGLWIGSYLVTGVRGDKLYDGALMLQNSKSISDVQWMGELQDYTIKNTVENNYDKDYVDLRIVKCGTEVYYFYNDIFYKVETRENFAGAIPVGLFANGRAEFTKFRFVDYSEKVDELTEYLSEYVYYVNVQKPSAKGSITSETLAVKKGDSITLSVQPGLECYLSKFTVNGESRYDELEANVDSITGEYVLTPTEDAEIKYTFEYFNSADLQNISILLKDSNDGSLANVSYRLTSNNPLIYYEGKSNDKGYVNVALPKSGVDIGSIVLDGTYELYLEAEGQKPKKLTFELPTDNTTYQSKVNMEKVGYGTLTVNGLTTKDATGTPLYDIEKDVYYVNGSNVVQYFVDLVSTSKNNYDYVVEAEINVDPIKEGGKLDDNSGVTGIVISSGGEGSIVLKQTGYSWEINRLCLQLGTGSSHELSIGGFNHSLTEAANGTIHIKLARYNNAIYVFDAEGDLGFYLDADGLHLVGDHTLKSGQLDRLPAINNLLKAFFERGAENAVGMFNVDKVKAEWTNVTMDKGTAVVESVLGLSSIVFETETADYSATITGVKIGEKYATDNEVTIVCAGKNGRNPIKLLVDYANGSSEIIEGVLGDGITTFVFTVLDDCELSITEYVEDVTYSGTLTGATEDAVLELYNENGSFIKTYENIFDENGNYSLTVPEGLYSAIVLQGNKVAFIDDLATSVDGVMVNAYAMTGSTYSAKKGSSDGEWTFKSTANTVMQQKLNYTTTGDYTIELCLNGSSTRGTHGTAGAVLYSGSSYFHLVFGTNCDTGNGMEIVFSDGTNKYTTTLKLQNGSATYQGIGRFNSSAMATNVKIVRESGVITVWVRRDNNATTTFPYVELFTVSADGIKACDNGYKFVNNSGTAIDLTTVFANAKTAMAAVASGENAFGLYHYSTNAYTYNCTVKVSDGAGEKLEGTLANAEDGAVSVELYDENGAYIATYDATVANGKYSTAIENATVESATSAIVLQGNKVAFIDDLATSVDGVMVNAYAMTGSTYTAKKDSADGEWTFNSTANTVMQQKLNYTTTGDYTIELCLSGSSTRGDKGTAGAILYSGSSYFHLVFGTNCDSGNGMEIVFSNGVTKYTTTLKLQDSTGADHEWIGRFNGTSMSTNVKIERKDGVITVSVCTNKSTGNGTYIELFTVSADGIKACDNGYKFVNNSGTAIDLATVFANAKTAMAAVASGENAFGLYHYSSNAYTYNCTVKVSE